MPQKAGYIYYSDGWRNPLDSIMSSVGCDYHNACAHPDDAPYASVPSNGYFFQRAHSGNGLAATDKLNANARLNSQLERKPDEEIPLSLAVDSIASKDQ